MEDTETAIEEKENLAGAGENSGEANGADGKADMDVEDRGDENSIATVSAPEVSTATPTTPAKPVRLRPALRGILRREVNGVVKWEGEWGMDDNSFNGGVTSPFSYTRGSVSADQDSNDVPDEIVEAAEMEGSDLLQNALFSGYFLMMLNNKKKRIAEKNVLFEFCVDDSLPPFTLKVVGSGTNQYGHYTLEGTLVVKTGELNVYREYTPVGVKPTPRAAVVATPATRKGSRRASAVKAAAVIPKPKARAAVKKSAPAPAVERVTTANRNQRVRRLPSHLAEDNMDEGVAEDLIKMKSVVRDLMKTDRDGWFGAPVDAEALGLANYHEIIKKPMDLGTVMRRLEGREYTGIDQVIDDVRLTFNNAITYNPDGHGVNIAARRLLNTFDTHVLKMLSRNASLGAKRKSSYGFSSSNKRSKGKISSSDVFGSSDDDSHAGSSDGEMGSALSPKSSRRKTGGSSRRSSKKDKVVVSEDVQLLREQVELMNKQIKMMHEMQQNSMHTMLHSQQFNANQISAPPARAAPRAAPKPARPPPPAKLKRDNSMRPLSYQEKRQLGQDINKLPGDMISGVIEIIQDSGAALGEDGDEVELDIEALDTPALKRLQKYVKRSLSKARSMKGREDIDEGFY